jgi:glycosyltransferase involved in cell wall biosynthesis
MKKRIIFIHLLNNFSGSPRVLKDTIEALSGRYNYLLLTSKGPGFLSQIPNSTFFNYDWSKKKVITLMRFAYAQAYFFFFVLFRTKGTDIIFINTMQPAMAAVAAKIRGLPVIIHIHETHDSQKFFGKFYVRIRKLVQAKEIFVSHYIASRESINEKNSIIIHNPISKEFIESAKEHTYNPMIDGKFNVLMICSLRDYKGIPEFLEIGNELVENKTIHFDLVLDASSNEIQQYFTGKNIPANTSIHSKTNKPEKFYKKASLLLNLSRPDQCIESFGLTIVEAMAFGIPCIVPDIGGPIEIVDDKINGFQLSCYDLETIINKILELSNDHTTCRFLSKNAKNKSLTFAPHVYKKRINDFMSLMSG